MNKKEIMDFFKENYKIIFFTILSYQLFLCIITFSSTNFKILVILLLILAGYIVINNWKSNSRKN